MQEHQGGITKRLGPRSSQETKDPTVFVRRKPLVQPLCPADLGNQEATSGQSCYHHLAGAVAFQIDPMAPP